MAASCATARAINPVIRGWMHYYGALYKTAIYPVLYRINAYLMRWITRPLDIIA